MSEVVELLDAANMEAVVRDFGDRNRDEDPVIHFYELFLKEYDAKKRMQRGVFYTPQPVVSYIVRSVHELLQTELGLEDGLASTATWGEVAKSRKGIDIPNGVSPGTAFVQILDPATGTATFLVEVIDIIHRTLAAKWEKAGLSESKRRSAWNEYVPKQLLPRLHGYELMMAPYAIAHMKIGLKLYETGYRFGSDERARVYLTNALEPAQDFSDRLAFAVPALAHEAQAVNAIKRQQCFTVVLGNPPYAQYSMNLNETSKAHIEKFRFANGQRIRARNALQLERNLNDDYVKFLGLGAGLLPSSGGVLGMITNRMYLDSESLVGLREWFVTHFDKLHIVDLWGSSEESRRVPRLASDENVFDILQGVAVAIVVRNGGESGEVGVVRAREVVGKRDEKYGQLGSDLGVLKGGWEEVQPRPGTWWLNRRAPEGEETEKEFTLAEMFPKFSTLVGSNRDHLVVDLDRDVVLKNVGEVRAFRGSNEALAGRFSITLKTGWNVSAARATLRSIKDLGAHMEVIEYRPFDRRWIFFHPTLVWQTAPVSSNNVVGGRANLVMISLGKNRAETINGQWVCRTLADKSVVSTRDNASGFPLYLYDDEGGLGLPGNAERPNLSPEFVRHLAERLGLGQAGPHRLPVGITPEDIFHYIYAVVYSPGYRTRYRERLKEDFPRIPLTSSRKLFEKLARLGRELAAAHLLEAVSKGAPTFIGGRDAEVERVSYGKETVWVDERETRGFRGVSEDVWSFRIGSYQVCEKWLKDRKGRRLSKEDIGHYQRIIAAIGDTIATMGKIDEAIEGQGGWPAAFRSEAEKLPMVAERPPQ